MVAEHFGGDLFPHCEVFAEGLAQLDELAGHGRIPRVKPTKGDGQRASQAQLSSLPEPPPSQQAVEICGAMRALGLHVLVTEIHQLPQPMVGVDQFRGCRGQFVDVRGRPGGWVGGPPVAAAGENRAAVSPT